MEVKHQQQREEKTSKPLAENKPGALTVIIVTGIITPPNNWGEMVSSLYGNLIESSLQ